MDLQAELLFGRKFRFMMTDTDSWSYNEPAQIIEQWIDRVKTGDTKAVLSLTPDELVINWGGVEGRVREQDLVFEP